MLCTGVGVCKELGACEGAETWEEIGACEVEVALVCPTGAALEVLGLVLDDTVDVGVGVVPAPVRGVLVFCEAGVDRRGAERASVYDGGGGSESTVVTAKNGFLEVALLLACE